MGIGLEEELMRSIPCMLMRGGTSKGPFLRTRDLPSAPEDRDRVLLAIVGSGHDLEIDGVGGGHPLSSKVAMVDRSESGGADVDYLFAQVGVRERFVDTGPNCGNMLVAVGPFAIEAGLVQASDPETTVRIRNINTNTLVDAVVQTPGGQVNYAGTTAIDGVPGESAPVKIVFRGGQGSKTGSLFPTSKTQEVIDGVPVTLIDMSVPVMMLNAESLGRTGLEGAEELDPDRAFFARIETLRLEAGRRMGLGDVSGSVLPKVIMVSSPRNGGTVTGRYFMPHACHRSFAVTGGICLATACVTAGTVAYEIAARGQAICRIEHPSGTMLIEVAAEDGAVTTAATIRTARKIFSGDIFVPDSPTGPQPQGEI
ncbi:4-oxalomesaconate tautomerase [Frigidibacter sp. MR17.14]|uniref:4-oxalomesaconate tautomerase n=1 Tax=Frigidibacter sp. MR17.14 TaxID=3126509 RepID=UPI003013132A